MKSVKTDIRVRYQETDNMGVVYYGNYFTWFEVARTEFLRSLGLSYRELEEKGMFLMVAGASCRYKAPARYDDTVTIETCVSDVRNSSMKFDYKISIGALLIATGDSTHVFTDHSFKPIRIPDEVKKRL